MGINDRSYMRRDGKVNFIRVDDRPQLEGEVKREDSDQLSTKSIKKEDSNQVKSSTTKVCQFKEESYIARKYTVPYLILGFFLTTLVFVHPAFLILSLPPLVLAVLSDQSPPTCRKCGRSL